MSQLFNHNTLGRERIIPACAGERGPHSVRTAVPTSQSPQRDHLLLFGFVQDIDHGSKHPVGAHRRQRLSSRRVVAGFQVSTRGRIWVSPRLSAR